MAESRPLASASRAFLRLGAARAIELFAIANLAFLAVDIAIAHAANHFRSRAEWVPIVFSVAATLAMIPAAVRPALRPRTAIVDVIVGAGAIVVGVAGMIFHLRSAFFDEETLKNLVYSAPFAAPLAYVGVGLLVLLLRLEPASSTDFPRWVVFFALGGFVGNFVLSLLDHAQNGFFSVTEWIPVASAAIASSFLFLLVTFDLPARYVRITAWVLALQVLVGVLGFVFHVRADLAHGTAPVWDRVLFGAPIFAPLLFADLAVLAGCGLWAMTSAGARPLPDEAPRGPSG